MAHTLPVKCLGQNESGWQVDGVIGEDYYKWVNAFEATHSVYGKVWGDFEKKVSADSKEGYENFVKNHPPEIWDYHDI
jgi:hypothetical protein